MSRSTRHPLLARLAPLVGHWDLQAIVDGEMVGGARATFEWIEDGDFLMQRAEAGDAPPGTPSEFMENSPMPVKTIIGLDDTNEQYSVLYADARGVYRVYGMSLNDGVWKQWRYASEFSQRFEGRFSDDGDTIDSRWEISEDGRTWSTDFRMVYRRVKEW